MRGEQARGHSGTEFHSGISSQKWTEKRVETCLPHYSQTGYVMDRVCTNACMVTMYGHTDLDVTLHWIQ